MLRNTSHAEMTYRKLGITMPQMLVNQMDKVRGDIPRSRYLVRLVEKSLNLNLNENSDVARIPGPTTSRASKDTQ
jgi:hypothetical protein